MTQSIKPGTIEPETEKNETDDIEASEAEAAETDDESETDGSGGDESDDDDSDDDSGDEVPDRLTENPAVALCLRAWRLTFKQERAAGEPKFEATMKANNAFLFALPPLSGYRNICDFIACTSQGYIVDAISYFKSDKLFAAAKIALSAVRAQPKPARPIRKRGRPAGRKNGERKK